MPRKKSLLSIQKPRMKLTSKGLKVTRPRARAGGVNLSSKGISFSTKTPLGSYNTRKGLIRKSKGCPLSVLPIVLVVVLAVAAARKGV